jgi:hypothetical protein
MLLFLKKDVNDIFFVQVKRYKRLNYNFYFFYPLIIFRISPKVNAFLNENSQEVFNEVKPEISKQVGQLVLKVMNDALSKLTEFL